MHMKFHYAAALGCAYFIGWSFVLAAMIARMGFFFVGRHTAEFTSSVILAWLCFTIPCALVAVLIAGVSFCAMKRSDRSSLKDA